MPNTPTIERVDHGMPAYTEEAQAAPHVEDISTQLHPDAEQTITEQAVTRATEPEHVVVQELAVEPETQHTKLLAALEPTNPILHDERHDIEDGDISDSLEATDMAGEMR
jgi:hypothetical protein